MALFIIKETIFIKTKTKDAVKKTLLANEKISVFSRTKGNKKNENTTVKIKKNLIMK